MIKFRHQGNFKKLTNYFEQLKETMNFGILDKYGQKGVDALKSVTPVRTGLTRDSWYYQIEHDKGSVSIRFLNSNIQNGQNIAIILDIGHGTRGGGWVQGRHYIEPAILPIFEELAKASWEEVKNL